MAGDAKTFWWQKQSGWTRPTYSKILCGRHLLTCIWAVAMNTYYTICRIKILCTKCQDMDLNQSITLLHPYAYFLLFNKACNLSSHWVVHTSGNKTAGHCKHCDITFQAVVKLHWRFSSVLRSCSLHSLTNYTAHLPLKWQLTARLSSLRRSYSPALFATRSLTPKHTRT